MPRPRTKNTPPSSISSDAASSSLPTPTRRVGLIAARQEKGLSQLELAELLGTTSVNVSRWERGVTRPTPYFRDKLYKLLGKSAREMNLTPELNTPQEAEAVDALVMSSLNSDTTNAQRSPADESVPPKNSDASTEIQETAIVADILPVFDPLIPLKPARPLIGRKDELERVRKHLAKGGNVALTALNGLPGVGKTALSITVANDDEVRRHFRDGILWGGLGPTPDLNGILSHWGTLLGIPESQTATLSSPTAWGRVLRTAINNRIMLIVIDDVWRQEDAEPLKVGGPHCVYLITTRFNDIASDLTEGNNEGLITLRELNDERSMDLLRRLAPNVVEMEEQGVQELVKAVGGLPLALTLIGNYLRKESQDRNPRQVRSALQRLSSADERLSLGTTNMRVESHPSLNETTHISLQTLFSVTVDRLSKQEQAALYALSILPPKPGDFSEDAATAVADCEDQVIYRLKDTGLVESKGGGRYTLHQTVADYAHLKLTEKSDQPRLEAQQRLIAYALDVIKNHRKDYDILESEQGVLLHALDLANTPAYAAQLIEGATGFTPFLLLRALYSNAATHLERAHALAIETHNERGIISTFLYQGELALRQSRYEDANSLLNEGLVRARQNNERDLLCDLLINLGGVAWKRGQYLQARHYFEEGLMIARDLEDVERTCSLLKSLALIFASEGNYVEERKSLLEGVRLAKDAGNNEQLCVMLMNLGVSEGEQGHYTQAEYYFHQGLEIAQRIGHKEWTSALLSNLGDIASMKHRYKEAEHYFHRGLATAREINNREWLSMLILNLGVVMREQRNYKDAETYLKEGLNIAFQIDMPYVICNGLYEYGMLALSQNDLDKAEEQFYKMRGLVPSGNLELQGLADYGIARVFASNGKFENAKRLAEKSIKELHMVGNRKADEVEQWMAEALPVAC